MKSNNLTQFIKRINHKSLENINLEISSAVVLMAGYTVVSISIQASTWLLKCSL
jgi:hypothetical protein